MACVSQAQRVLIAGSGAVADGDVTSVVEMTSVVKIVSTLVAASVEEAGSLEVVGTDDTISDEELLVTAVSSDVSVEETEMVLDRLVVWAAAAV